MCMNLVNRSKSLRSLLSRTTCFRASWAGEPCGSHFVFCLAVGEMGSCAQRLYNSVESHLCLSATWCSMLIHFSLRSRGLPSHVTADHQKMICDGFNPRTKVFVFLFFGLRCQLRLDLFTQMPDINLVFNPLSFVLIFHQCLDSCVSVGTDDFYGNTAGHYTIKAQFEAAFLHRLSTCSLFHMANLEINNFVAFFFHRGVGAIFGTVSW